MFNFYIKVVGRNAVPVRGQLVGHNVDVDQVAFDFSSEWNNLQKVAVFFITEDQVYEQLVENDVATVPSEVLQNIETVKVGVYSPAGSGTTVPVISSTIVEIKVDEGTIVAANANPGTYENIFLQIIAKLQNVVEEDELEAALALKQDVLTPGSHIDITNDEISVDTGKTSVTKTLTHGETVSVDVSDMTELYVKNILFYSTPGATTAGYVDISLDDNTFADAERITSGDKLNVSLNTTVYLKFTRTAGSGGANAILYLSDSAYLVKSDDVLRKEEIKQELKKKQNILTAGEGIIIDGNEIRSRYSGLGTPSDAAEDFPEISTGNLYYDQSNNRYYMCTGISYSSTREEYVLTWTLIIDLAVLNIAMALKQDNLTAGDGINITNNTIKSTRPAIFYAVWDETEQEYSYDKNDYPATLKEKDLILEGDPNVGQYKIYIVFGFSGDIIMRRSVAEDISIINSTPPTTSNSQDYEKDSIVMSRSGKMYICTNVSDDGEEPATYTYTWQEILTDYSNATNKPQINGVTLSGNKTSSQLGLESEFNVAGHLSKSNGTLTNTANKNYNAVYDEDDELSLDIADYPGIKTDDLLFEWVSDEHIRVYRVTVHGSPMYITKVCENITVVQNLMTESYGHKFYGIDDVVILHNGKIYRCIAVSDDGGQPPEYSYTWQEVRSANRVYDAVISNNSISYDVDDYPGIEENDIAILRGHNKARVWYQVSEPDTTVYWAEIDYNNNHVYDETTAPPQTATSSDTIYHIAQIGDIWVAKVTQNNVTTTDIYILDNITQSQSTRNLTWSKLTHQIPSSTSSDSGKFLRVNAQGQAVWETVISAGSEAY